jgi:hypothetical protein
VKFYRYISFHLLTTTHIYARSFSWPNTFIFDM